MCGLIEGCVDSHVSALAACRGGADRLELCANLSIGGTTPSPSLFQQVRRDCPVKVNVLIRPRFGDFLYSEMELEEMREEIRRFRDLGANGVVIILTSGQAKDAPSGTEVLKALHAQAAGRIHIMAGGGVRKETIRDIHRRAGIRTFHTTGRSGPVDSGMLYRKSTVSMGLPSLSEYELWQTNEAEFRACAEAVHSLGD